jgi:hypothetical protein
MWPSTFEQRLAAWSSLRAAAASAPLDQSLSLIHNWWQAAPWQAYHLHWDDRPTWPDPWQILSDNIYCDLAKGLGILYTITMLDRADCQNSMLIETDQGNLVLVNNEKYILNWGSEVCVNTSQPQTTSRNQIAQCDLKLQLY